LGLAAYLYLQSFVGKREAEVFSPARAERWSAAVAADLDALEQIPFVMQVIANGRVREPDKDAGGYLNRRLKWELAGEGDARRPLSGLGMTLKEAPPPVAKGLELPLPLLAELKRWDKDWLRHAADASLVGVSFAWMKKLPDFAYWDFEATGPGADLIARGVADAPLPTPDFRPLNAWVKLRLLSALQGEPAGVAFADVEQLARLALSTQRYSGILTGLSWLVQENRTAQLLRAKGVDAAPSLSEDEAKVIRRAVWAEGDYLDVGASAGVAAQVFPVGRPRLGACAAVAERLPTLLAERATLNPYYPDRFAAAAATLDRVAADCRPMQLLSRWHDPAYVPAALAGNPLEQVELEGGAVPPLAVTLAELSGAPFARRFFGLALGSLRPNGLELYEKESAPAAD
jgi:hypothetical protein